jgi:hypothetical protein
LHFQRRKIELNNAKQIKKSQQDLEQMLQMMGKCEVREHESGVVLHTEKNKIIINNSNNNNNNNEKKTNKEQLGNSRLGGDQERKDV